LRKTRAREEKKNGTGKKTGGMRQKHWKRYPEFATHKGKRVNAQPAKSRECDQKNTKFKEKRELRNTRV